MAEVKTEQEPSIEEILESIRQIISDDVESSDKPIAVPAAKAPEIEMPVAPKTAAAPPPATVVHEPPAPKPAAVPKSEPILDLTDRITPAEPAVDLRPQPPQAPEVVEKWINP